MHTIAFIHDLAIIMLAAGVVTIVFHLLRQPVVLGYIVAGVLIGPHTPPYSLVTDETTIQTLAELGLVFLLFSLGLEFSLRHLRQVGATALIAALAGIVLMFWAGYEIGRGFGWHVMDAVFLGAMLSISSTTITIKALDELGLKKKHIRPDRVCDPDRRGRAGDRDDRVAVGRGRDRHRGCRRSDAHARNADRVPGRIAGRSASSRSRGCLISIARFNSNEMLLVAVLGLLFGFCLLVARLGYSVALGAFVIGVIMAEAASLQTHRARDRAGARHVQRDFLRRHRPDARSAQCCWTTPAPIAVVTVVLVIGKVLARSAGAFAAGQDARTSLRVGMSLAQIGEFSFIIATLGTDA